MDRNKNQQSRAKTKKQRYPADLFALGNKSSGNDNNKRPLGTVSASTSADRKRETPASQSLPLLTVKKPKTTIESPTPLGRTTTLPTTSTVPPSESWESLAIEVEQLEFVPSVLEAYQSGQLDRVDGIICGAVKQLKSNKWKPDNVIILGLQYLAKVKHSIFSSDVVTQALSVLLKRDPQHNFKSKGNPAVAILAANLLLRAYRSQKNWPTSFLKLYVEDSMSERVWVDAPECKAFVDNLLTAFDTKVAPRNISLLLPEVVPVGNIRGDSPLTVTIEDEDEDSASVAAAISVPIIPRYNKMKEVVDQIVLDSQLHRRQTPEAVTRNYLRFLSSASGLVDIRLMAAPKLELWLQNPKLMKPSQELLMTTCLNCNTHSDKDVQVIAYLAKIRLKTKALINFYLACIRELTNTHPDNLSTILKHTVYNELSTSRNPNNMSMLGVMFQSSAEQAARLLADIFVELLLNKEDYHRSLRSLFREIVRQLRHDINLPGVCRSLMIDKRDSTLFRDFEFKDRMFYALIDLISLSCFLGVSPAVKEAATLSGRGDNHALVNYHNNVSTVTRDCVDWLKNVVPKMFRTPAGDFVHALHKILFVEQPDAYYKIDMWPPESERSLLLRLASEAPLQQDTFLTILHIGLSKEHPISAPDALELADQLVKRSSGLSHEGSLKLQLDRLDIFELVFDVTAYHHPDNITLPHGYTPPRLAISNLYWKGWVMLLLLSSHNPSTLGTVSWEKYPMLKMFMEMCITNQFTYPPPTAHNTEDVKSQDLQMTATERHVILEFESHLAAASTKQTITEQNSLLLPQLITMDPLGPARRPPQAILEQLRNFNMTHRMGHLLCRSRHPDFLLDLIQRQGTSQSMPWLADLVENSEGSLSHLPVQCLCEFLLSSELPDKQTKSQQLIAHLQQVLSDTNQDPTAACEILEYLLRRLSSPHLNSRCQAIKGLKLVLSNNKDELHESDDYWLLKYLPALPHFQIVRPQVVSALRQACLMENHPLNISRYITFLALHTGDDNLVAMGQLVQDMAQVIVERSTIMSHIMPAGKPDPLKDNTLHSLMIIFCSYLDKAREPKKEAFAWSESQDQILVTWSSGENCTMHILVVHAMVILLCYGPANADPRLFSMLMETWFPSVGEPPKSFLVDTSEEALLIPDWLKLRMIRSGVDRLVDAALRDLDIPQLVLFIQSFGIPVSSMTKLLATLDRIDQHLIAGAVFDKSYMAQLVEVQRRRGVVGGHRFLQALQLTEQPNQDVSLVSAPLTRPPLLVQTSTIDRVRTSTYSIHELSMLLHIVLASNEPVIVRRRSYHKLQKMLLVGAKTQSNELESAQTVLTTVLMMLKTPDSYMLLVRLLEEDYHLSCTLFRLLGQLVKSLDVEHLRLQYKTCCSSIYQALGCKDTSNPLASLLLTARGAHAVSRLSVDDTGLMDCDDKDVETRQIGCLIDSLVGPRPQFISTCSQHQIQLLFRKSFERSKLRDGGVAKTCRPYLLTLLIHRASWAQLQDCLEYLLTRCDERNSAKTVLDFLEALTKNPRLWQGREKHLPKHQRRESVFSLNSSQILCLIEYVTRESQESDGRSTLNDTLGARLPFLLQFLISKKQLRESVLYLSDRCSALDDSQHANVCKQLLVLLYLEIPGIIYYLSGSQMEMIRLEAVISGSCASAMDRISHNVLTAMTTTIHSKDWMKKSQDYEVCARKMAAVHPPLVLRQLPMLAATLQGRVHLEYVALRVKHHINVFVQVLGLLELLRPYAFSKQHTKSLHLLLDSYLVIFKQHGYMKDIAPMIPRFVTFLQQYMMKESKMATGYIQNNSHFFSILLKCHSNLSNLRNLLSGVLLQTRDDHIDVEMSQTSYTDLPTCVPRDAMSALGSPDSEELITALQTIDQLSIRNAALLENMFEKLSNLLTSPYQNVRVLSLVLFARLMKHNPQLNGLTAYMRCLESGQGEIVNTALEKLPEMVICLQEHSQLLLYKVFSLGIRNSFDTSQHINKAVVLLNLQSGC